MSVLRNLMLGERIMTYKVGIGFMIENSTKRARGMIDVIMAYMFLNQRIITEFFNFPNYHFMMDKNHLFKFNVEERFGKYHSDLIKNELKKMACAHTEAKFEEAYNAAMGILRNETKRNVSKEEEIVKFLKKDLFARTTF